ncbi:MAG: hypothetical protein IKF97_05595 [Clostridia bacterium]|nr:hypothetical protein [Clostridia bacterium]
MKRPIVIEFSGLPNSGKTTLLRNLKELCSKNNVNAIFVQETAELLTKCITKGSIEQNLWITLETLQRCLEIKFQSDANYILLDRGFYDQLFWVTMYKSRDADYSNYFVNFMNKFADMYDTRPDYLYVIDVDVDKAIERRMASGEPVTFSKKDFLLNYKAEFNEFTKNISPKLYLDTTNLSEDKVSDIVFNKIISL